LIISGPLFVFFLKNCSAFSESTTGSKSGGFRSMPGLWMPAPSTPGGCAWRWLARRSPCSTSCGSSAVRCWQCTALPSRAQRGWSAVRSGMIVSITWSSPFQSTRRGSSHAETARSAQRRERKTPSASFCARSARYLSMFSASRNLFCLHRHQEKIQWLHFSVLLAPVIWMEGHLDLGDQKKRKL